MTARALTLVTLGLLVAAPAAAQAPRKARLLTTIDGETVRRDVTLSTTGDVTLPGAEGAPEVRVGHDAQGLLTSDDPELTALLRAAKQVDEQGQVELPSGARFTVRDRQVELLPRRRTFAGESCQGQYVTCVVDGELSSGRRFAGELELVLWQTADDDVLAIRLDETLKVEGRETPFELSVDLRPAKGEKRVGALPALPTPTRHVSLPGSQRPGLAQTLLGTTALGGLCLALVVLPRLGREQSLILALCLGLFLLPAFPTTAEAGAWDWAKERFTDVTENELLGTALAVVVTGVGATVAAVTAPAWVPIAVAAAGTTAVVGYYATRTPPIRSGDVVDKRHEPANTYVQLIPIPITTSNGKTTTTTFTYVPMVVHDDEDWVLKIEDGERSRTLYVEPETYAQVEVGQRYDMDTDGGSASDEHAKRDANDEERQRLEAAQARGEEQVDLGDRAGIEESLEQLDGR